MRTNREGQELIKSFESLKLEAYYCSAGKCTIGWGSTFYTDGSPIRPEDKINLKTAEELFEFHVIRCEEAVSSVIMTPVTNNEFSAMVSLCYNIGPSAFKKSTLIKMLNANKERQDVAEQFLRWNLNKGKVERGLVRRREAEKQLFLKP